MSAAVQGFPFWRGLLLREYREHRALFLYMPLASLLLASFLLWRLSLLAFEEGGQLQGALSLLDGSEVLTLLPLFSTPHTLYLVLLLFSACLYTADCLARERRDQSFLFWQSMPVSDGQTIVAKASAALLLMPLCYSLVLLGISLVLVLFSLIALLFGVVGFAGFAELLQLTFAANLLALFSGLLATLWIFPLIGWLALFSAYGTRWPFVLAVAVIVLLSALETALLESETISLLLRSRVNPFEFLILDFREIPTRLLSYELLSGVLLGSALLVGAMTLRKANDTHRALRLAGIVIAAAVAVVLEGSLSGRETTGILLGNPFFDVSIPSFRTQD
jgi:ABC-2 type transport system permease protein